MSNYKSLWCEHYHPRKTLSWNKGLNILTYNRKKSKHNKQKLLVEDFLEMVSKESLGNSVRHQDHKGTGDEWATEGTGKNG